MKATFHYSIALILLSTWLVKCHYISLSFSTDQKPNAFNGTGIRVDIIENGNVSSFMDFVIEGGLLVTRKSNKMKTSNGEMFFQRGSHLNLIITDKSHFYSNCNATYVYQSIENHYSFTTCFTKPCAVGTINTKQCSRNNNMIWKLDNFGSFGSHVTYGPKDGNSLELRLNFSVVDLMNVVYKLKSLHCLNYLILQGSRMNFTFDNPYNKTYFFSVNNSVIEAHTKGVLFSYQFIEFGQFTVKINGSNSFWELNVKVVKLTNQYVAYLPKTNNFSTNENVTVTLSGYCLYFNKEYVHWGVNVAPNKTKIWYNGTSSFIRKFHSIGSKSTGAVISVYYLKNKPGILYPQLYDKVGGFQVSEHKNQSCSTFFILNIREGSSAKFYYKFNKGREKELETKSGYIENDKFYTFNIPLESNEEITFYARNPISSLEREKSLSKESFAFAINLTDNYYLPTNKIVEVEPELKGLCGKFQYQWHVDGKSLSNNSYLIGDNAQSVILKHNFSIEGKYDITINVKLISVIKASSAHVYARNKIIFNLQDKITLKENEVVALKPTFNSTSKEKFEYKWNGSKVESSNTWITSSNLSSIEYKITTGNWNLTLTIKNEIYSMYKTVQVITLRRLNVSIHVPLPYCNIKPASGRITFKGVCQVHDNYYSPSYKIFISYGPHNDTKPKSLGSVNLRGLYGYTGLFQIYCMVLNVGDAVQVYEKFSIVVTEDIKASISSTSFIFGESMNGKVTNPSHPSIPYKWYIANSSGDIDWKKIHDGPKLPLYQFLIPGRFIVSVAVDLNGTQGCHQEWTINVNIPLTLTNQPKVVLNHSTVLRVRSSSIILPIFDQRNYYNTSTVIHIRAVTPFVRVSVFYQWYANDRVVNDTSQNQKDKYFLFPVQGIYVIRVDATTNGVSSTANVTFYIEEPLSGTEIKAFYGGGNEVLPNGLDHVPSNIDQLELLIGLVPSNATAIFRVYCYAQENNVTFFDADSSRRKVLLNLFDHSGIKLFGNITCFVNAVNNVSFVDSSYNFIIAEYSVPRLHFINPTKLILENDIVKVKLKILHNSVDAKVDWIYNQKILIKCGGKVKAKDDQLVECLISLESGMNELKVLLSPINQTHNSTAVSKKIYSVNSFTISPSTIQVGRPINITTNATGSQLLFLWDHGNSKSTDKYLELYENQTGVYPINLTVYNPISKIKLTQNLTIINANIFTIISTHPKNSVAQVDVSTGQRVILSIDNLYRDVKYSWDISTSLSYNFTASDLNSKSIEIYFHDINGNNVFVPVAAKANLNGIDYNNNEHFVINVYQKITNLQHTLKLASLFLGNEYTFNITWDGPEGKCKVDITGDNSIGEIYHTLLQFENKCKVTFHTKDLNKTISYIVDVEVSNPGSILQHNWTLKAIPKKLNIDSLTKFTVNKTFHFEVTNYYENATYMWYLTNSTTMNSSNITTSFEPLFLGSGKSLNVSFPPYLTAGEYIIIVKGSYPAEETLQEKFHIKILPRNATEIFKVIEYPLDSTFRKNSTIKLEVMDPYEKTEYIWFFLNGTTEQKIGDGSEVHYMIPSTIRGGNHTFIVRANGPLLGQRRYKYFFTFCRHSDPYFVFGNTRTQTKSQWFYSEVKIEADCAVKYKWSFLCYNKSDINCHGNSHYRPKNLEPVLNKPTLELAPRSFVVGKYLILVKMQIGTMERPLEVVRKITVKVVGTPLVPAISGGLYRVIGDEQTISLNAGGTIDPDISYSETPKLYYKWEITNLSCYVNMDNISKEVETWSSKNEVITIRPKCLQPGRTYYHTVYAKRVDGMEKAQQTSQEIYVIAGKAPLVQIECFTCKTFKSFKYTRNRKMRLFTTCSNCDDLPTTYSWQIRGKYNNVIQKLDVDVSSSVLVLPEYALADDEAYEVIVTAKIQGMTSKGSTKFTLEENTSPVNGTCTITPNSGDALVTDFSIKCSDWVDCDNTQQPFIYWLVAYSGEGEKRKQTVLSRGILKELITKLPVGDQNRNNTLHVQIWIQDSLGAYTIGYDKNLTLKPSDDAYQDPIRFIEDSVLPGLQKNVIKKDLNQVTASVIGASTLLTFDLRNSSMSSSSSSSKESGSAKKIVETLITSTAELEATSVETIEQILNAFTAVSDNSKPKDIKDGSRSVLYNSLTKIVNLSTSFTYEGLGLNEDAYNSFTNLLGSNIKFANSTPVLLTSSRKKRSVENRDDENDNDKNANYDLLQRVYIIALRTTMKGENAKLLKGPYIITTLQRRAGNIDRVNKRTVGACSVFYNINKLMKMDEVLEIAECSSVNPFEEVEDQLGIVSLSLKDQDFVDLELNNLPGHDINIGIPTQMESTDHLNLSKRIGPEDIIWTPLVNLTEPEGGWNHSSIHIVIDTFRTGEMIYLHLSKGLMIDGESRRTVLKKFQGDDQESRRTVTINGMDLYNAYVENTTYYFGVDHDFKENITVNVTVYFSTCRFWNVSTLEWEGTGCFSSEGTTRQLVDCRCNHLTSFGSSIVISPNELDFSVLKKLNIEGNPIALATCVTIIFVYLIFLAIAVVKDRKHSRSHVIPFIGSDEGFYHYEIRMKTGAYPWAGTSSNVGLQIFGTSCTTKVRVMKGENAFQRNSLDIFRISVDRSIGKIYKIRVWHDDSGPNASWYIQRVVIRSLVNGEKFFFFCNKWIGTDCGDGELEHDFHVADTQEMQKFSTIFYDILGRGFNDYHLCLSLFERPKFSKFTRVQRLTCIFTFIFSWMAINAMWFQVAPEGKVDVYIGFQGFSYEEILIGLISSLIVFPLNLFFLLLFRKSRTKEVPVKPLKIWKEPRRVLMDDIDLDESSLIKRASEEPTGFKIGDSTLLHRGKKHFDVQKLIEQFEDDDLEDFNIFSDAGDNLIQRTRTGRSSSTSTNHTLTLPHSFDSTRQPYDNQTLQDDYGNPTILRDVPQELTLKMSPQHQYRTSSMTFPKRSDYKDLVKETMKRTQSADSFSHLFSNEERRLLKNRLSTDELRSHMTDIVEQQLSNLVHTANIHSEGEGVAFLSDYTNSRGEYQDTKLLSQIKKNEELAVELQIPQIIELDSCTRWSLPYWCSYIGFVCCFLLSAFCIVIVLTYGQQFGREKTLKWLKALLFGFLEDFFLTYPFVLILTSAFLALVIKPLDLDQIDHYDFVICPSGTGQPMNGENISPPTGSALESAKREGEKRKESRRYAKDVILQLLLLWLVISICTINFANSSPSLYQFMEINDELKLTHDAKKSSLNEPWDEYWSWLDETFIPSLYRERNFDQVWLFASAPYIRQVRVTKRDCPAKYYASLLNITQCNSANYQQASYDSRGWKQESVSLATGSPDAMSPWRYDGNTSSGVGVDGKLDYYPSKGYYFWLPKDITYKDHVKKLLNTLKGKLWIDGQTRLLQHTAVLYNPNINVYAYYNLFLETVDSQFTSKSFTVDYFKADFYIRNVDRFSFFCVALLALIMIILSWKVVKTPLKHGWSSLKRAWYLHLTATVIITLLAIILHIVTLIEMSRFKNVIQNGDVAVGSNVAEIASLNNCARYFFSISVFLVIIRTVRLVSWSGIYKLCSKVFLISNGSLFSVLVFHIVVVVAFSHFGYLLFQEQIEGYHTYRESFLSTMLYRWWKPGPRETIRNRRGFGMLWNILYMIYWLFISLNLFKAVMISGKRLAKDVDCETFWKSMWRMYVRRPTKKQRKHVHFNFGTKGNTKAISSSKPVEYDENETTNEFNERDEERRNVNTKTPPHYDLPPLPYSMFELDSNLISALAGLDKMISDDVWEEEMFSRFGKYYHPSRKIKAMKIGKK